MSIVYVERITHSLSATDTNAWDTFISKYGSVFQCSAFCQVVENAQLGVYFPRHLVLRRNGAIIAIVPAYLYTSCPRLDYYRVKGLQNLLHVPILLSHSLIGWRGYPVAANQEDKELAIQHFYEMATEESALAMFIGIDERDTSSIHALQKQQFALATFHTSMVRDLSIISGEDPTAYLPYKYKHQVRNLLNRAQKAGTGTRLAGPEDTKAVVQLIMNTWLEKGISPDVLPAHFVEMLLTKIASSSDILLACDPKDNPVGVVVNLKDASRYTTFLAGQDKSLLNIYFQAHLLYEESIRKALRAGYSEIDIGRSPNHSSRLHGYKAVSLLCAIRASNSEHHQQAVNWIKMLEARHLEIYHK